MIKASQGSSNVVLYEHVDINRVRRLMGYNKISHDTRILLRKYHNNTDTTLSINAAKYCHSKIGVGRLFAQGGTSLQCFEKNVRNYLAEGIYTDIDMINAGPRLISQYCEKNNIQNKYIRRYVDGRENILKKIMKFHDISRDEAKNLVIRLCNGSGYTIETAEGSYQVPEYGMDFLLSLKAEIKDAAKVLCKNEKDLYDKVKKSKEEKGNLRMRTFAIYMNIIENDCLMKMMEYFTKHNFEVGVLCFDGFMVLKEEDDIDDKTLAACEKYVHTKTGYNIQLAIKEMTHNLGDVNVVMREVFDDVDCANRIFDLVGKEKFVTCNDKLYVFNEKTGMFNVGKTWLNKYLKKYSDYLNIAISTNKEGITKYDNYGKNAVLMRKMPEVFAIDTIDDEWTTRTELSSLGYLLYRDGIYNMKTGEFTREFDPSIVFHFAVPHYFPKRNEKKIKYARSITFDRMFDNPEPMITALACALAGEIGLKTFYLCPGDHNAGKSLLSQILKNCFGKYVATFTADNLAISSGTDTKDQAQKYRWALAHRYARILTSSEVSMQKPLDGDMIKKHASGGNDALNGREHYKSEEAFRPNYTMFSFLNDIPEIKPFDNAVNVRLKYIEFPFVFLHKDKNGNFITLDNKEVEIGPKYKEANKDMDKLVKEQDFIDGFTHLIFDYYLKYLREGFPIFDDIVKEKWTRECKEGNNIGDILNSEFVITGNKSDFVIGADMKIFYTTHIKKAVSISITKFYDILRNEHNLTEGRKGRQRGWYGIKSIHGYEN